MANPLFEDAGEIVGVGKACRQSDLGDRLLLLAQKKLGLFDPKAEQMLDDGATHLLLKDAVAIAGREETMVGNLRKGDLLGKMPMKIEIDLINQGVHFFGLFFIH